jgi:hypothetical protein
MLSAMGAGLFFACGSVWMRLRALRAGGSVDVTLVAGELKATRAHMLEQERVKQKLKDSHYQLVQELSRSQLELQRVSGELQEVRASQLPPPQAHDEFEALQTEITQLRHDCTLQARELTQAERAVQNTTAELQRLESRVAELTERASAEPAASAGELERELAFTREALQAREAELERLNSANTRLAAVEVELAEAQLDVERLRDEARGLRAELYRAGAAPAPTSERPQVETRGAALQALVENEIGSGRAKSAVIADELGLLVVSSGVVDQYGDALAAFGAYLADFGTKTRDLLPLCALRQVVVRDDRDTTLTVQPLAADDAGLALVTLTVNPPPLPASELPS